MKTQHNPDYECSQEGRGCFQKKQSWAAQGESVLYKSLLGTPNPSKDTLKEDWPIFLPCWLLGRGTCWFIKVLSCELRLELKDQALLGDPLIHHHEGGELGSKNNRTTGKGEGKQVVDRKRCQGLNTLIIIQYPGCRGSWGLATSLPHSTPNPDDYLSFTLR